MSIADAINGDGFSLMAEVDPPRGPDCAMSVDGVLSIRGRVNGVIVSDSAHALMRMSPLALCRLLVERNVEPVMSIAGRNRNRLSFQGDLLGAWALGVRAVLIGEGQDPAVGDQPMARSSGDLDMDTMLGAAAAINRGCDLAGEPLDVGKDGSSRTDFLLGVALEVSDDIQMNRRTADLIRRLPDQGVRFVVLGPTYDINIIGELAEAAGKAGIKILASVRLLISVAMIRYLNSLEGVPNIPHEYLKQMTKAPVKVQAGMEVASSFLKDIEDLVDGAMLVALGWGNRLPEFLARIGR